MLLASAMLAVLTSAAAQVAAAAPEASLRDQLGGPVSLAAEAELLRRDVPLAAETSDALADALLERQADVSRPWRASVDGAWLAARAAAGELSPDESRRFRENRVLPLVQLTPFARQGAPINGGVQAVWRGGPDDFAKGVYRVTGGTFAGRPVESPASFGGRFTVIPPVVDGGDDWEDYFAETPGFYHFTFDADFVGELPPGEAELVVRVVFRSALHDAEVELTWREGYRLVADDVLEVEHVGRATCVVRQAEP